MGKFLVALLVSFGLAYLLAPVISTADVNGLMPDEQNNSSGVDSLAPPRFTLQTQVEDSNEVKLLKAAMRLFKEYAATELQLRRCITLNTEGADATLKAYNGRNGLTLSKVVKIMKLFGGMKPDAKAAMDAELGPIAKGGVEDCAALVQSVKKGDRDLYQAKGYAEDYKLVNSFQK